MASHAEVAHKFAQGKGGRLRGHHMFYEENTLFSYGYHFPLAHHTKDAFGRDVTLLTTRGYSVSTSKHKTITWRACHHLRHMYCENVLAKSQSEHIENVDAMRSTLNGILHIAAKRRIATYAKRDFEHAQTHVLASNLYIEAFKVECVPLAMPSNLDEALADLRERISAERKAIREREEKERAARLALFNKRLPLWRAGENVSLPQLSNDPVYYLRIKGDEVQTSGHASFPIDDAKKAWPKLIRLRAMLDSDHGKLPAIIDGLNVKVGYYDIKTITKDHIRAGCHLVPWSEVEYIANELELTEI